MKPLTHDIVSLGFLILVIAAIVYKFIQGDIQTAWFLVIIAAYILRGALSSYELKQEIGRLEKENEELRNKYNK